LRSSQNDDLCLDFYDVSKKLIEYGYHIDKHIKDLKQYKFVVAAFQRHFQESIKLNQEKAKAS
jgi:N-acetyl-anhydromuramyl-L-alanine amidase AmpD